MTDTNALSAKLGVSRQSVLEIIRNYIESVRPYISYTLLDVADKIITYSPYQSQNQKKDWTEYHRILYSNHYMMLNEPDSYLFIIGGNDIIPVPLIKNFVADRRDVPADIFYGYNGHVIARADINLILSTEQQYYVGRLPLGTDASFSQLETYLNRAAKSMSDGIPVQMAYAQCDPNWKKVTREIVTELDKQELIPDVQADKSLYYDKVFLSPYITTESIQNAFNTYANLIYFNMHGSDNPMVPQFIGQSDSGEDKGTPYRGIGPESLSHLKYDNIVVTEACFGGKYHDLSTNMSMLLSAMSNKTLVYLGSSITAYGATDSQYDGNIKAYGADTMARTFVNGLIQGYTCGESLQIARRALFNLPQNEFWSVNMLTIVEFSLFGDPSLKAHFPKQADVKPVVPQKIFDKQNFNRISCEEVYSEHPDSILSVVRNRVDARLQELNVDIQKHLKDNGIEPRKLTTILKVRYGTDSQHLFSYETEDGQHPVVAVSGYDNRKTVFMPKMANAKDKLEKARLLSINYSRLFHQASLRFGLIEPEDETGVEIGNNRIGNGLFRTVYIDKRIDEHSKKQIEIFNLQLEKVYLPKMDNQNIAFLSTKSIKIDEFSSLLHPLDLLLENELRRSVGPCFKHHSIEFPDGQTLGEVIHRIQDNIHLLSKYGIIKDFVNMLWKMNGYRKQESHVGGVSEETFLEAYTLFISIVTSKSFVKLMDLKLKYKK